jgi:hypothetical protein
MNWDAARGGPEYGVQPDEAVQERFKSGSRADAGCDQADSNAMKPVQLDRVIRI